MHIPTESLDSKMLRWSGLMLTAFLATVFAVGVASSGPSAAVAKDAREGASSAPGKV